MSYRLATIFLASAFSAHLVGCCSDDPPSEHEHEHGVRAVTEQCYAAMDRGLMEDGCPGTLTSEQNDNICRLFVTNFYDTCGDVMFDLWLCKAVAEWTCYDYGADAIGCQKEAEAFYLCQGRTGSRI